MNRTRPPKNAPLKRTKKPKTNGANGHKANGHMNGHSVIVKTQSRVNDWDKTTPAKIGRPTLYREEYAAQAEKLCRLGATDVQLAHFFGVSPDTIDLWKTVHEPFVRSIKVGRGLPDDLVERSLYQKAVGFWYREKQAIKVKDGPNKERIEIVEVEKYYVPDTTAQIFWLKNRRKEEWRDVHKHEHGGHDGGPLKVKHELEKLPDDKLDEIGQIIEGEFTRVAEASTGDRSEGDS